MKFLYDKIDKSLLATLPQALFKGPIYEIFNETDAEKATAFLMKQEQIGLDTETRPVFKKGMHRMVSLLQLATRKECFLFHLNAFGLNARLISLLEDVNVCKIGLSLGDDINALKERKQFTPRSFIDLQDCIKELGIEDLSLQKLYANLFHQRISKTQQLSNWEAMPLNEKQRRYAATDAWACLMLHDEYVRLKQSHDYELRTPDTQPQIPR